MNTQYAERATTPPELSPFAYNMYACSMLNGVSTLIDLHACSETFTIKPSSTFILLYSQQKGVKEV